MGAPKLPGNSRDTKWRVNSENGRVDPRREDHMIPPVVLHEESFHVTEQRSDTCPKVIASIVPGGVQATPLLTNLL